MLEAKIVYIIPGFKHKPTNKAYKAIAKILKSQGFSSVLVSIPWRKTTISQNTAYFLKKYKKLNSRKKYILGFSFGAMIAFLASTKVRTSGLILCSLSPYFKEDMVNADNNLASSVTKQRFHDFKKIHCATLAKQVKAKQILMLYGAKETKPLIKRVRKTFKQITSTKKHLIPVKETEHNIGDKQYLHTIHHIARELL